MNRDELIDVITAQVLAALKGDRVAGDACGDCRGSCASTCTAQVRGMVANGTDRVSFTGVAAGVPADLAQYIDHTLLKPDAAASDIDRICDEAAEHSFASVCVNPYWVRRAAGRLRGSKVVVASVIGFPFGAVPPEVKATEARRAIRDGARELDMVINIGALKSRETEVVFGDIKRIAEACRESGARLKVIIETAYLTDEEKVIACDLAKKAKANFVKTSTGYGPGGATARDVMLMREVVGDRLGVKASGGIRTREDVQEMLAAGASRIGASAGVAIVTDGGERGAGY